MWNLIFILGKSSIPWCYWCVSWKLLIVLHDLGGFCVAVSLMVELGRTRISVFQMHKSPQLSYKKITKKSAFWPLIYSTICGSSPQPSQTAQDLCLDWDTAVHQKTPAFLALQHHHHSSWWGRSVGLLGPTEKPLKDLSATINDQKSAQTTSDSDFNENPTKNNDVSVIKNQSGVEKILHQAGQGSSAGMQRCCEHRQQQQQQWAAGVISSRWRARNHLARLRKALRGARHRHLENFYSRAKVCAATSCYCSAASLNISCFSACKKLFLFCFVLVFF